MASSELVRTLASAWTALHPDHEHFPEERQALSRQTEECLAFLTGEAGREDPAVTDLALARSVRLCEQLARAIQNGTALHEPPAIDTAPTTSVPPVHAMDPSDGAGPLRVRTRPGPYTLVEVRGYVAPEPLRTGLARLGALLAFNRGALLIDATGSQGHDRACSAVLADWVADGHGLGVRKVAVVVERGMQFVRASRALSVATGVAWCITHDRLEAERWLARV